MWTDLISHMPLRGSVNRTRPSLSERALSFLFRVCAIDRHEECAGERMILVRQSDRKIFADGHRRRITFRHQLQSEPKRPIALAVGRRVGSQQTLCAPRKQIARPASLTATRSHRRHGVQPFVLRY
jgi:hypothetical protein